MSKKRIRAQLHKSNNNHANGVHDDMYDSYILPATADAYERMVEQMHNTYAKRPRGKSPNIGFPSEDRMKAALRAIGITPPKKGQP